MAVFQVLEFVAIFFLFVILGGVMHRRKNKIIIIVIAIGLCYSLLGFALGSPIPYRWAFVLVPMTVGFVVGYFMHKHKNFLGLLIVFSLLVPVLSFMYTKCIYGRDSELKQRILINRIGYSTINIAEFTIVFFLALGIMRLLKRDHKGWALIIALCLLSLDTDIWFLSFTAVPIACSLLLGYLAWKVELSPPSIPGVLNDKFRHVFKSLKVRFNRGGISEGVGVDPGISNLFSSGITKFIAVLGPIFTVVIFIGNLNFVWVVQRLSEEQAITVYSPGMFFRIGADWSFAYALLAVGALPMGVLISKLFSSKQNEKSNILLT